MPLNIFIVLCMPSFKKPEIMERKGRAWLHSRSLGLVLWLLEHYGNCEKGEWFQIGAFPLVSRYNQIAIISIFYFLDATARFTHLPNKCQSINHHSCSHLVLYTIRGKLSSYKRGVITYEFRARSHWARYQESGVGLSYWITKKKKKPLKSRVNKISKTSLYSEVNGEL